jgi:hypothetical protein
MKATHTPSSGAFLSSSALLIDENGVKAGTVSPSLTIHCGWASMNDVSSGPLCGERILSQELGTVPHIQGAAGKKCAEHFLVKLHLCEHWIVGKCNKPRKSREKVDGTIFGG